MKIVILGAGAIGRLFGVYLARAGQDVVLVEPRREVVQAINSQGIGFLEADSRDPDSVVRVPAQAVTQASEISGCDLVILAVKSFDTLAAVRSAAHLVDENSPLISLQTGLAHIDLLDRIVPRRHLIGGFTFMAATALDPGTVRHGGHGRTYLGELDGRTSERVREIADLFDGCGLECRVVQRIIGRLWCKVIVYSAINAVTAILRVRNGELLDNMESVTLLKRLIDEGRLVAEAMAIDLVYHDLYQLLFDACRRTGTTLSSMLQDILEGKRTEIDAQCGALARFGDQVGIATPTQQTMVELVRLTEKKSRAGSSGGGRHA